MDLNTLLGMMTDFGMIEIIAAGLVISAVLYIANLFIDYRR